MNQFSDQVKEFAESYIRTCWPRGVPANQAIEIKLAFYAGMMAMGEMMVDVSQQDIPALDARDNIIALFKAVAERATNLNIERNKQ